VERSCPIHAAPLPLLGEPELRYQGGRCSVHLITIRQVIGVTQYALVSPKTIGRKDGLIGHALLVSVNAGCSPKARPDTDPRGRGSSIRLLKSPDQTIPLGRREM
jgi:hypothetical protein